MNRFKVLLIGSALLALMAGIGMRGGTDSSWPDKRLSGLPADIAGRVERVAPDIRARLLDDPLFLATVRGSDRLQAEKFMDAWLDGATDNFCREFLYEVAIRAYDVEGVKKLALPRAQAGCPKGVPLAETLSYVNGLLQQAFADPYTQILAPKPAQDMIDKLTGNDKLEGGLGLIFTNDRSRLLTPAAGQPEKPRFQFNGLIYHVVRDGPAAAAGLQDGDWVEKVDDAEVAGQDADHVIDDLLRGRVGSAVKLTVKRGDQVFERTVRRGVVRPEPVWSRSLGNGIYAVVITRWEENVSTLIYNELKAVQAMGARGVIIDVRNNGGGEFIEAVAAASMLIKNGVLVSVRERLPLPDPISTAFQTSRYEMREGHLLLTETDESTGKSRKLEDIASIDSLDGAKSGKAVSLYLQDMPPVVVLGDEGTASASEVFIGSLIKNKVDTREFTQGATFIGKPTVGKGIEQNNAPAALRTRISVTSGRIYLNDGFWAGDAFHNRHPLQPDLSVEEPEGALLYTDGDAQLKAAVEFLLNQRHPVE